MAKVLLKGGVVSRIISFITPVGSSGSGSYNWQIPSTQILGSDYQIRITSTTNSTYKDTSDGHFAITAQPALPVILGIDISNYTGDMPLGVWQNLNQEGYQFVVVQAWGGRGKNARAQRQLENATTAGLKTAAYALLNFDNLSQNGTYQINQAIDAVGKEKNNLTFLAIDIEPTCDKLGRCWAVNAAPQDRIREAVKAVNDAGLKPIIYSNYYIDSKLTLQ